MEELITGFYTLLGLFVFIIFQEIYKKISNKQNEKSTQKLINNLETNYNDMNWNDIRISLFLLRGHKCDYCGSSDRLQVHHKQPISRGGDNHPTNLVILCKQCHQRKHKFEFKDTYSITSENYGKQDSKSNKIQIIKDAIKYNKVISIIYRKKIFGSNEYEQTERLIKPIEIYTENNRLYVKAFCYLRNAERNFKIINIKKIST
jgi:hypothetical protein